MSVFALTLKCPGPRLIDFNKDLQKKRRKNSLRQIVSLLHKCQVIFPFVLHVMR